MLYISLVDIVFCRQIGYLNFFIRGIKIKVLKTFFKNSFTFTTVTKSKYKIYKWDPSGSEVYLTQCFTDWGNEYIFLDSKFQAEVSSQPLHLFPHQQLLNAHGLPG